MVHVPVNLVFVNPFRKQLGDDEVYFGSGGVVSESSGVGHHSAIYAGSCIPAQTVVGSELVKEGENNLAGGASDGIGDKQMGVILGVKVVVDDDVACMTVCDMLFQIIDSSLAAKIQRDNQVRFLEDSGSRVPVVLRIDNAFALGKPGRKSGKQLGMTMVTAFSMDSR